jgi:hypothetical protein
MNLNETAAKLAEAAEWAADLFEQRTRKVAANTARVDEVLPDTRVQWSEIRDKFAFKPALRSQFQLFFDKALSHRGLLGVLRRSESAVVWVERRTRADKDRVKRDKANSRMPGAGRCCRVAAKAIVAGEDPVPSVAARELAALVLSAVKPEPEDPDYDEYFGKKGTKLKAKKSSKR